MRGIIMNCEVIAEIGWNHMGDMVLAKEMIASAAEAGADYVKFQTWSTNKLKQGAWNNDGRYEIYKKAELSQEQHVELSDYCQTNSIKFLTSIFNENDVSWLSELCGDAIKVPSHEVYNKNLISKLDAKFEKVFISTGASTWDEVSRLNNLVKNSTLYLLHCVSSYPCPPENVNLPRIAALKELCENVGYSGHFFGIDDAIAAISYDLRIIEKHFTLDRSLPGRDNQYAILPNELKQICDYRDNFSQMQIKHGNEYQKCEQDIIENYRGRWSKT